MKKLYFLIVAALIFFTGTVTAPLAVSGTATDLMDQAVSDPLNVAYWIEDPSVALMNSGRENSVAPGSAMKIRTAIWKEPVYGDLDGDRDDDAA